MDEINTMFFRAVIRWYDIEAVWAHTKALKRLNKKHLWNLGTEVNRPEMEGIKSVKLRDDLKIHQRQTGHDLDTNDAKLVFRRGQYNFRTSICKKIL